jgi:lysophospholipase L1-like esterase
MLRTSKLIGAAAAGLLLTIAACHNDELLRSAATTPIDPVFARYVSVGNSITAGFQSGGINDSTQQQSYANVLAGQMHTPFFMPLLNRPGCPPPIDTLFTATGTPHRVGGGSGATCLLRKAPATPPPFISDVAVPGAWVIDATSNLAPGTHANTLTTLLLGGLTQTQSLLRADPTFVTVWLGNNDVLSAATSGANAGDTTLITDSAAWAASYKALLDSIDETPASGKGVLMTVANVTLVPFFSRGQVYFSIKNTTPAFPTNFQVGANCAPSALGGKGDSVLVPFQFGLGLIGIARADPGHTYTLNCTEPQTIQPRELQRLVGAVNAYNAVIAQQATARGYALVDVNALFTSLADSVPLFPNTSGANAVARPFGTFFSRDGVHPSGAAHKLLANALVLAINAKYGTNLTPVP